jgi:hypothetical protein
MYLRVQREVLYFLHCEWQRGCDDGAFVGGISALIAQHYWYLPLTVTEPLQWYALRDYVQRQQAIGHAIFHLDAEVRRLAHIEAATQQQVNTQYIAQPRQPFPSPAVAAVPTIAYLRAMPYAAYLRTEHWQTVRKAAIKRADGRCQLCNASASLDVHHRTYERRGCERDNDVIALCRDCHDLFHTAHGSGAKSG